MGFYDVWLFPDSVVSTKFISTVKLRVRDQYVTEWNQKVSISSSLQLYKEIKGGGGSTLYEIYIGFCPRIDFNNIMHIDCLTYNYSICDIVFLLPIYMVKKRDVM